jgi:hypothetical protein
MAGDAAVKIKPEQLLIALLAAAAVALVAAGVRKSGGVPAPATATIEGGAGIPEPIQPVLCMPDEHLGQVVYTKHRYPARVGGELTTVIHYGHSALSVPSVTDGQWIINPPSEVTL